jgi:anion-transporting  ArsA/GET3 family ATPase
MGSLLSKRLIFVSGKGGVGKTTVALALGLLAAEQGRRCLVVEIDTTGAVPARFDLQPSRRGVPLELAPRLFSMIVEGRAALDEYLRLLLPGALLRPIFSSKIYDYFVAGAPGLKELMCMGKIFYEVERAEKGRPHWDLVVVDAPATGHGLELYRMPQAAHDTFAVGLVHRETERVLRLLRDPSLTSHLLVTLAEELPVSETIGLYRTIRDELRFPLGPVVVNRVVPSCLPQELVESFRTLRSGITAEGPGGELLVEILEKTELFEAQHLENRRQIERLDSMLGAPRIELAALFVENLTPELLEPLLRGLDEQISAPALVRGGSR